MHMIGRYPNNKSQLVQFRKKKKIIWHSQEIWLVELKISLEIRANPLVIYTFKV